MSEERNCENCGSVHCYSFEPKYHVCKNGSLWTKRDERMSMMEIQETSRKLLKEFSELNFRPSFNLAIQAFYLEERLYVVRSHVMGKYQYTLVEADSEEQAIRKCI